MTWLHLDEIASPIGKIYLVTDDRALCALDFEGYEDRMKQLLQKRHPTAELVAKPNPLGMSDRLRAYLSGDLTSLANLPVNTGGTAFQQQVWQQLRAIAPGTTATYGELAQQIDSPKAVRAVGMANSQNPVAIALPCHRVIGANRKLTGYAGGIERKRWLLAHEGVAL